MLYVINATFEQKGEFEMFVSQINSFHQDVKKEISKKENVLKSLNGSSKEKRELQEEIVYLKKFASQLENICVFTNIAKDNIRSHVYDVLYKKGTYNQYKKMYQSINNQLIKVLDLKDSVLGDKKEDEVIIFQTMNRALNVITGKCLDVKKDVLDCGFEEFKDRELVTDDEKEECLFDSSLYESLSQFSSIQELLDNCLEQRYGYKTFLSLAKSFMIYQKESLKYSGFADLAKAYDADMIIENANNAAALDMYEYVKIRRAMEVLLKQEDYSKVVSLASYLDEKTKSKKVKRNRSLKKKQ